jgi:hypothetical protein
MDAYRCPDVAMKNFIVFSSGSTSVLSTPSTHTTDWDVNGLAVRSVPVSGSQKNRYEFELMPRTCAAS